MGACLSSARDGTRAVVPHLHKGPDPYDSVWSVAEHQNQQQQLQQQQQQFKHEKKHTRRAKAAAKRNQLKQKQQQPKRMPQIDIATGEVMPDFGVQGVFDVLHELGSGGSGQAYLCRDLQSSKIVAVKFVPRPLKKAAIPFMMAEVEIQAELGEGSLNLVTMHEIILTRTHLALVLEYASGGSLTEKVASLWESALQRGGLFMEEQEASYHLRQVVHCINFCHKRRVAHRDLKLDNTLLEECILGPPRLKICDFGFARRWTGIKDTMHDAIGTPVYMSPQMLAARQCSSGYSGVKADMWAVGVLLFVMLLGSFPFDHDATSDPNSSAAANEVWLKQQQGGWRKSPRAAEVLKNGVLSEECCDLLDKLLMVDEDKRVDSSNIMNHPWLQIPLTQQQQDAWQRLQREQADLDNQLQKEGNPRLAKLRSEAMFAMMAIAAKPPCRGLYPTTATAVSSSLNSANSAGSTEQASGNSTAASCAVADHALAPPPAAAAAVAASQEVEGIFDLVTHDDAMHISFTAGEGMRTSTLEQKVVDCRQQQQHHHTNLKNAHHTAATEASHQDGGKLVPDQHQQQQVAGSAYGHQGDDSNSSNSTAAAVTVNKDYARSLSPVKWVSSFTATQNSSHRAMRSPFAAFAAGPGTNSSSHGRSSATAAPAVPAAPACSDDSAHDADVPDEVWRLPLSSIVDPSVYKLTPELSVAAGALIRQLQKEGEKVPGRGRSARSSCPMY